MKVLWSFHTEDGNRARIVLDDKGKRAASVRLEKLTRVGEPETCDCCGHTESPSRVWETVGEVTPRAKTVIPPKLLR